MAKTLAPKHTSANARTTRSRTTRSRTRASRPAARSARAASGASRITPRANGKYVYFFGSGKAEGDRTMKDLLGGKGSGLAEMTNAGLPVPAGMTISTEACTLYYKEGRKTPAAVDKQMLEGLKKL